MSTGSYYSIISVCCSVVFSFDHLPSFLTWVGEPYNTFSECRKVGFKLLQVMLECGMNRYCQCVKDGNGIQR